MGVWNKSIAYIVINFWHAFSFPCRHARYFKPATRTQRTHSKCITMSTILSPSAVPPTSPFTGQFHSFCVEKRLKILLSVLFSVSIFVSALFVSVSLSLSLSVPFFFSLSLSVSVCHSPPGVKLKRSVHFVRPRTCRNTKGLFVVFVRCVMSWRGYCADRHLTDCHQLVRASFDSCPSLPLCVSLL